MLQIIYAPHYGAPIRDRDSRARIQHLYDVVMNTPLGNTVQYITGCELFIHTLRVMIKRGEVSTTFVNVYFDPNTTPMPILPMQHIQFDSQGRVDYWPHGFCDYYDELLEILVDWNEARQTTEDRGITDASGIIYTSGNFDDS